MTPELAFKIKNLPDSPGCYIMKSGGEVIYVGKAKNLKNRVRQYFQSSRNHTAKVCAMVEKIDDFDIVLVDGELEALILECNLIKLHRPFYNILLKDDKQYPYIAIDPSEPYPRIQLRRKIEKDGCRYFGPYRSASVVREVMDVVRDVFPVRACDKPLKPGKVLRPCVHHAVGRCLAPCTGNVDRETYAALIRRVIEFLNGKYEPILRELNEQMKDAAASLNYERAALYRDRIRAVESVTQKQKAASAGGGDIDALAVLTQDADALVQRLSLRGGKLIEARHSVLERAGDETPGAVLTSYILQRYDQKDLIPREILLPCPLEEQETVAQLLGEVLGKKVILHVPERGEKKKLVEMAEKNARDEADKRARRAARTTGALAELAKVLNLPAPPRRIEGYDISNTQGAQSIGSMVVMIDGTAAHREYRQFRIKTVEGANDFASMKEVIDRRLRHGLTEMDAREAEGLDAAGGKFSDLPDLILIDGGPGQLGAAREAMRALSLDIPMFGLAKRIEEIVLPGQQDSLLLDRHSEALHLIQRLRDEAHRFGITQHRKLRAKVSAMSALDGIPGIGEKKRRALLTHFKTIEELRSATPEQLAEAEGVGPKLAETICAYFQEHKAPGEAKPASEPSPADRNPPS